MFQEDVLAAPINNNQVLGDEEFEDDVVEDEGLGNNFDEQFTEAQARGQEKRIHIMEHLGQFH